MSPSVYRLCGAETLRSFWHESKWENPIVKTPNFCCNLVDFCFLETGLQLPGSNNTVVVVLQAVSGSIEKCARSSIKRTAGSTGICPGTAAENKKVQLAGAEQLTLFFLHGNKPPCVLGTRTERSPRSYLKTSETLPRACSEAKLL